MQKPKEFSGFLTQQMYILINFKDSRGKKRNIIEFYRFINQKMKNINEDLKEF